MEFDTEPDEGQEPEEDDTDGSQGDDAGQDGDQDKDKAGQPRAYSETYVKKLRTEAAKHRTELKRVQEEVKALKQKDLSEQEKLSEQVKELQGKLAETDQRVRKAAALEAAVKAGANKPDLVAKLIVAEVEDEADMPDAVKALKKEHPEFFGGKLPPKGDGGDGTTGDQPQRSMNNWIREMAGYKG